MDLIWTVVALLVGVPAGLILTVAVVAHWRGRYIRRRRTRPTGFWLHGEQHIKRL